MNTKVSNRFNGYQIMSIFCRKFVEKINIFENKYEII